MTIKSEHKDGRTIIRIGDSLVITDVAALHQELIAGFESHEAVSLDMRGVDDLDTAGMQILISACRSAEKDGRAFSIEGMSDKAVKAVNRAGMKPEMLCREFLTGLKGFEQF